MRCTHLVIPLLLLCLLALPLAGQSTDPGVVPSHGTCVVRGTTVILTWRIPNEPVPADSDITRTYTVVMRDGLQIARLPYTDTSYVDSNVPEGRHEYLVVGVRSDLEILLLQCEVVVRPYPGPQNLTCDVICPIATDQKDPSLVPGWLCSVSLAWENPINYLGLLIVRDNRCLAILPGASEHYLDRNVAPGEHHYEVYGIIRGILPTPADELLEALNVTSDPNASDEIAREALEVICPVRLRLTEPAECKVRVPDVGPGPGPHSLVCLVIEIDNWGQMPELAAVPADELPPAPFRGVLLVWINGMFYDAVTIARDGVNIAVLPGKTWYFLDPNVPSGKHEYQVRGVVNGQHTRPAVCEVKVPGPNVPPPPQDLVCRVICPIRTTDPATGLDDVNAFAPCTDETNCQDCPVRCMVAMSWRNPTRYQGITVTRDGLPIARLPGDATNYLDREPPSGYHIYGVYGVRDGVASEETLCRVWVPPVPPVQPPYDLRCLVVCAVPDDNATGDLHCNVHMTWENGQPDYDKIIIRRDGEELITLPGDAESHTDVNVPHGEHTYTVSGVVGNQMSRPAACRVRVPEPPLEPPFDLVCLTTIGPDPALDPGEVDPSTVDSTSPIPMNAVYMRWRNGSEYDAILIYRDGEIIEKLPGTAQRFIDYSVRPGPHDYAVTGLRGNEETEPATCHVVVPPYPVPPPRNLVCEVLPLLEYPTAEDGILGAAVKLTWELPPTSAGDPPYDGILIFRNGSLIARLPGSATGHLDRGLLPGAYVYNVVGVKDGAHSLPAICTVKVPGPVPPPQDLTCEVLPVDCIDMVGADCPIGIVKLAWRNPVRYARILIARNGEEIAQLPGDQQHYYDRDVEPGGEYRYEVSGVIASGEISPPATCTVTVPPVPPRPPWDLECEASELAVKLAWKNGQEYDAVMIVRDGVVTFQLPGDATDFLDENVEPGSHCYRVYGMKDGMSSAPVRCCVLVPGPQLENILYFIPLRCDTPGTRCLGMALCAADNKDPLEAWSFGVCNDPTLIFPTEATTEGTFVGELGLDFVVINVMESGVTMAAIVQPVPGPQEPLEDGTRPTEIEPGERRTMLYINYERKPGAVPADVASDSRFRLDYCGRLGEPPVAVVFVVDGYDVKPKTVPGSVIVPPPGGIKFIRGDANANGFMEIGDPITVLMYLFQGGDEPPCLAAANANASTDVDIADGVFLLNFLFMQGPPPPHPFPDCGYEDESVSNLSCESFPPCEEDAGR